jgi:hypothetical protein
MLEWEIKIASERLEREMKEALRSRIKELESELEI